MGLQDSTRVKLAKKKCLNQPSDLFGPHMTTWGDYDRLATAPVAAGQFTAPQETLQYVDVGDLFLNWLKSISSVDSGYFEGLGLIRELLV